MVGPPDGSERLLRAVHSLPGASLPGVYDRDGSEGNYTVRTSRLPAFLMSAGPRFLMSVSSVTDSAQRAAWLFEHLTREYELLRNPDDDDRTRWVTIPIDSKVFDADKGNEAVLREMVNTVGSKGKPGEHVRAIVSVNMLSEG